MQTVEIVGGPRDGSKMTVPDDVDYISLPVQEGSMDGPLGLIPKFSVATLPVHEGKAYWNERY